MKKEGKVYSFSEIPNEFLLLYKEGRVVGCEKNNNGGYRKVYDVGEKHAKQNKMGSIFAKVKGEKRFKLIHRCKGRKNGSHKDVNTSPTSIGRQ